MRDEVDELVEAWARERSDLDLGPVEVFSRISRLSRHLDLARRAAFSAEGIESWEFDVLAALRRAGTPYELSPGRLLRETLVTSGTMTNRVDRLVARGLVERLPDPADRRGVKVRLTPYQTLPDSVLAVRNPLVCLAWSWNPYQCLPYHQSGSATVLLHYYQSLPAAELNTHTMISSILFYILIVGLLAYASYLKHQIRKR